MNKLIYLLVCVVVLSACEPQEDQQQKGESKMELKVTSTAFEEGGMIPAKYTADGQDISPSIAWTSVPDEAKSIVLICDDPDAPMGTWVHWLVWNIPPDMTSLDENMAPDAELSSGIRQGTTDFRRIGYGGPAPPSGVHRYFFKVYALDTILDLPAGATKPKLEEAMDGHVLAKGELIGRYTRQK
jgi:Raf kinase inhibitor-like YbhB/YbcL family protein